MEIDLIFSYFETRASFFRLIFSLIFVFVLSPVIRAMSEVALGFCQTSMVKLLSV